MPDERLTRKIRAHNSFQQKPGKTSRCLMPRVMCWDPDCTADEVLLVALLTAVSLWPHRQQVEFHFVCHVSLYDEL